MTDRRAIFFVIAAGLCFALLFVALPAHRPLAAGLGTVYLILSAVSALDSFSKTRRSTRGGR